MRFILLATIFLLVMAAANYYIYRRFLRKLSPGFNRYAWLIPAILMLGEIFFVLDIAFGIFPDSPLLYYTTSAFVGVTFMLFVVATIYDLTITVSTRVPFRQERRKVIKVIFDITILIAAMTYVLRGLANGIKTPMINNVKVRIRDFPLDRFTLVQLTDIHVGRTIKRDFIEDLVTRTNAMQPDMIAITGDLVDLPIDDIKEDLEPLKELKAPSYFILGNHEYFHGAEAALEHVRSLGIRPLLNQAITVEKDGKQFNLVGINDLIGERFGELPPDYERPFQQLDNNKPCIVLSHQPKSIERLNNGQRCDLMLSGHTHGGQIFPFGLLVMVDQPYLSGLHQHDADKQIFVSRGTGYWGPPLRILAPSEISRIVIRPA